MRRLGTLMGIGLVLAAAASAGAGDWPQWRGPDRTGISKETGLLKAWPAGGPNKLWSITTPGKGFAAPSVVGDTIYITGAINTKDILYAIGLDGKVKWSKVFGVAWTKNYPMSRCTPTIEDGAVYLYSGGGTATCLDAKTGEPKWTVDTIRVYRGQHVRWGMAESPLIVDEMYFCAPGGPDAAVVALNKKTGKLIWRTKGFSDRSAYCSPIRAVVGGTDQIITQTEAHVVGIATRTGKVLWKVPQKNRWAVHPNTPLVFDGLVYVSCGYGWGSQLIKLSADGTKAQQVWRERQLDNHHEAVLLIGGRIYGSSSRGKFLCLNPKDGSVLGQVEGVRKAAITYADGRIYAYDEKGGAVSLIEPTPTGGKVVGQFTVTEGSGPHWAHPVVANGVLYIRHGEAFMAYSVKQ